MTQGDLVMSMDQLLTKPRLGTCHKFYMHPFTLANSKKHTSTSALTEYCLTLTQSVEERLISHFSFLTDEVKTLMFFEGCPSHLGCSIKLRGASEYELARVKEIIRLMVCVAYHSQLEISFLMDEFAMPPSLAQSTSFPCLLEGTSAEKADGGSQEKSAEAEDTALAVQSEEEGSLSKNGDVDALQDQQEPRSLSSVEVEAGNTKTMTSSPFPSPLAPSLPVPPPFLMEEDQEMSSNTLTGMFEGDAGEEGSLVKENSLNMDYGDSSETQSPRLFRDPLQDDTGMFVTEQVASFDDHLKSISAVFKQELKDIILCISPFITFKKPFLLTPDGMHCPSREYFPEQVPVIYSIYSHSKLCCTRLTCVLSSIGLPIPSSQQGF